MPAPVLERVFRHLCRYRVTTPEALARLVPSFRDEEVYDLLSGLAGCEFVERVPGVSALLYRLTADGAAAARAEFDLPDTPSFVPTAGVHLLRSYGALAFCCEAGAADERTLLTADEVRASCPALAVLDKKQSIQFFTEAPRPCGTGSAPLPPPSSSRLGVLCVDPGRSPERLCQALWEVSDVLARINGAHQAAAVGGGFGCGFGFGIVVPDAEKKARVQGLLRRARRLPSRPEVVVARDLSAFYPLLRTRRPARPEGAGAEAAVVMSVEEETRTAS